MAINLWSVNNCEAEKFDMLLIRNRLQQQWQWSYFHSLQNGKRLLVRREAKKGKIIFNLNLSAHNAAAVDIILHDIKKLVYLLLLPLLES